MLNVFARVSPSAAATRIMLALVSSLATAGLASASASATARRSRCEDVWFSLLISKIQTRLYIIVRIIFNFSESGT